MNSVVPIPLLPQPRSPVPAPWEHAGDWLKALRMRLKELHVPHSQGAIALATRLRQGTVSKAERRGHCEHRTAKLLELWTRSAVLYLPVKERSKYVIPADAWIPED